VECKKHKKAVADEISLAKGTIFFATLRSILDDNILVTEGAYSFHTVKHHSGNKRVDCTSVLFKTVFPNIPQMLKCVDKDRSRLSSYTSPC
jgi:hypothetical protein